jgi:hypothetical protein
MWGPLRCWQRTAPAPRCQPTRTCASSACSTSCSSRPSGMRSAGGSCACSAASTSPRLPAPPPSQLDRQPLSPPDGQSNNPAGHNTAQTTRRMRSPVEVACVNLCAGLPVNGAAHIDHARTGKPRIDACAALLYLRKFCLGHRHDIRLVHTC